MTSNFDNPFHSAVCPVWIASYDVNNRHVISLKEPMVVYWSDQWPYVWWNGVRAFLDIWGGYFHLVLRSNRAWNESSFPGNPRGVIT